MGKRIKNLSIASFICSLVSVGISFYNFNGVMSSKAAEYGQVAFYGATAFPTVIAILALVLGVAAYATSKAIKSEDE